MDEQIVHESRKPKRRRLERLEGWAAGTSPMEVVREGKVDQITRLSDWKEVTVAREDGKKNKQKSIQEWTEKEEEWRKLFLKEGKQRK